LTCVEPLQIPNFLLNGTPITVVTAPKTRIAVATISTRQPDRDAPVRIPQTRQMDIFQQKVSIEREGRRSLIKSLKPYPEYKDSGSRWLGEVPAHWEVRSLRTFLTPRSERNRPELPLLSVARERGVFVRSLTGDDDNHNVISEDLTNYKVARAGDLVINKMKAWQGSMGIAPCDGLVSPAYFVFEFRIA